MKILWHSVAPWAPTGYGQQTGQALPRIRRLGHDVAGSFFYGVQGRPGDTGLAMRAVGLDGWEDLVGIPFYPPYNANVGADALIPNAVDWFSRHRRSPGAEPDAPARGEAQLDAIARGLIVTLYDVWPLDVPNLSDFNVAAWCPIDHISCPDSVRDWFRHTKAVPIAMSHFGEKALADRGIDSLYVPHGIDTGVFCPGDQKDARERMGVPQDRFVIALVAANVGRDGNRKEFAAQLSAFAALRDRHDDAFLLVHTDVRSPVGTDVSRFLEQLPDDSYLVTDQVAYRRGLMSPAQLADLYRCADVLTNCSWGEGFGIPIVEAQACGTPVVVTDATAMPELCGAGWTVAFEPLWHDTAMAWAAKPLIGDIVRAYEEAYDKASGLRGQAAEFGRLYDADFVAESFWAPALETLAAGIGEKAAALLAPSDPNLRPARIVPADGLLWYDRGEGTEDSMGWSDHESTLAPVLLDLLPEGGTFIDVGAHVGHWALRLAAKADQVVAVEPSRETGEILRRNIALNDLAYKVWTIRLAAWDRDEMLSLHDPYGHLAGGSSTVMASQAPRAGGLGGGVVNGARLDEVTMLKSLKTIDLIKLDVEGADLRALEGMRGLLERFHPKLFIERHDMYGYYLLSELEDQLRSLGYTWSVAAEYFRSTYLLAVPDAP